MICILAFAATSYAEEKTDHEECLELCERMGQMAETIMGLRQSGVPMSKMLDKDTPRFVQEIIVEAYEMPDFSGHPELVNKVIRDHGIRWHTKCLRDFCLDN
jgi:hypothetical protein